MKWFEVDKEGLARLLERKGKEFIIYELVQNAWDEKTTRVDIILRKCAARAGHSEIFVEDDNPDGFKDLSHAFTLFAESGKTTNAEQRGRFNLGEKLVLALCRSASIATTSGSVIFDKTGRKQSKARLERGSQFAGVLPMSMHERGACAVAVGKLIPPQGVDTYYNGALIPRRTAVGRIDDISLPTEIADGFGLLKRTTRSTFIEIFETRGDEPAMLYELGIPVVETGDRWHVNVGQKIPLNMDRDNVTPAFLGMIRHAVAERMARELTSDDASSTWVRDAMERHGDDMSDGLVRDLVTKRFGEKRVIYDPSDPEANALAVTQGYTVVHGSNLSGREWETVKRVGAMLPAGRVTPSPKPFSEDGTPLRMIDPDDYTAGMCWFVKYARSLSLRLLDTAIDVEISNDITWRFGGCYGARKLIVNAGRFGKQWFDGPLSKINEFIIHEFGHHFSGNHLSDEYHDALCMLGGKLSQLALDEPKLFKRRHIEKALQTAFADERDAD